MSSQANRIYLWVAVAVVMALVGLAYIVSLAEVVTLRADTPIPLTRSPIRPPIGENLVHTLAVGELADVIECENIKTNLVILVRTRSGKTGYVADGDHTLIKQPFSLKVLFSDPNRLTLSCRGWD